MNRLLKKCVIASTGLHLFLILVLVIGPGFLAPKSKSEDVAAIDFVPMILVDGHNVSGGGNPNAKPPPAAAPVAAPTPPAPKPEPVKVPEPDPPKDAVKEPKIARVDPDSFQTETKKKLPQISTTPITRKTDAKKTPKTPAEPDPQAKQFQQLADARRKAAEQINRSARDLRNDLSSSTTVETNYGPGGGGETYASYAALVKMMYENAWILPDDTASDDAIGKVSVTIAHDGSVMDSHITKPSGDAQVDASINRALNRVTFIAPFPEGAKDKQRTYIINFNLKAKRGLG